MEALGNVSATLTGVAFCVIKVSCISLSLSSSLERMNEITLITFVSEINHAYSNYYESACNAKYCIGSHSVLVIHWRVAVHQNHVSFNCSPFSTASALRPKRNTINSNHCPKIHRNSPTEKITFKKKWVLSTQTLRPTRVQTQTINYSLTITHPYFFLNKNYHT